MNVTTAIKYINQPRGGYIKHGDFTETWFSGHRVDSMIDTGVENLHPTITGLVVDYLTRLNYDKNGAGWVFHISVLGMTLQRLGSEKIDSLINTIENTEYLSDDMIKTAVHLVNYDTVVRAGYPVSEDSIKMPDEITINHIRQLVKRSIIYLDKVGLKECDLHFDKCAFSDVVTKGDAGFMSDTKLIDMKVSKGHRVTKDWSMQLYIYYLLAKRSNIHIYHNISHIAIYNPRLDVEWSLKVDNIDNEIQGIIQNEFHLPLKGDE